MTRIIRTLAAAALVASLGALAPAVHAQAAAQLSDIRVRLAGAGNAAIDDWSGWLDDDETEDIWMTLLAGNTYEFIGTCDRDCTDLDLRLYDAQNALIDSDTLNDDTPIVSVSPRLRGRYRLEVKMFSCSVSPCEYRVGTFRR